MEDIWSAYNSILKNGTTFERYLDFENVLIANDADEYLELHFEAISNRKIESLYTYLVACFDSRKDKVKVSAFLSTKYNCGIKDPLLKADVIQILGQLRYKGVLKYAQENLYSTIEDLRYRSIIVIGWVGEKEDVVTLNNCLIHEPNDTLRGYSATAMRQIWYNHKSASEDILTYLYEALKLEKSEITLGMIIIVIQDLLHRKFGLQEKIDEGIIKGDVIKAKAKIIKTLDL